MIIRKQIIFDFDGVILKSHKVKSQAFYDLFSSYGKKISEKVLSYHLKNEGKSRFIKFKYIYKNILKEKISKKKLDLLSKNFDAISLEKINELKIPKYLIYFLKKNKKKILFHISTGTPQKIIEKILKKKKINHYFKNVYGSPAKKIVHINKIKKNKKDTLFIGDSFEDFLSCKKTKTQFLLKIHNENKLKFKNLKINKIKNFKNLENFLNKNFL